VNFRGARCTRAWFGAGATDRSGALFVLTFPTYPSVPIPYLKDLVLRIWC
jgi:hypothetical protein